MQVELINRIHLLHKKCRSLRERPLKPPEVGLRQFTTPSPSITACTVTWRVMCMKSANGANIGMKITDSPVPDEIREM